jgi:hypothetical protein
LQFIVDPISIASDVAECSSQQGGCQDSSFALRDDAGMPFMSSSANSPRQHDPAGIACA